MKESVSDAGAEDVTLLTKLSLSAFCGEEVVVRTKIKSRGIKSWDESWCCSSPIDQVTRSVSSEYIRAAGSQSTTPQLIKCECAVVRELLVWIPEPAGKIYIERERVNECITAANKAQKLKQEEVLTCLCVKNDLKRRYFYAWTELKKLPCVFEDSVCPQGAAWEVEMSQKLKIEPTQVTVNCWSSSGLHRAAVVPSSKAQNQNQLNRPC